MAKYRIMTFDGGGILGLLTTIMLEKLVAEFPGLLDQVDLFAGTSTGGLIALGLAKGKTPTELRNLYEDKGKDIFRSSLLEEIIDLAQIKSAHYHNDQLTAAVKNVLGEATLLKDLKRNVIIPSFDLDNEDGDPSKRSWKPKFFHNFRTGKKTDNDREMLAYKVALYTSAAPTYFPSVDGYIDGGVMANNPSMAAVAQTQDKRIIFPTGKERPVLTDIVLLSFSCGKSLDRVEGKDLDWGAIPWMQNKLIQILLNGGVGVADYQCKQLLGENYYRIDPPYPAGETYNLDDVKKVPALVNFSGTVNLKETRRWIKDVWMDQPAQKKPTARVKNVKAL